MFPKSFLRPLLLASAACPVFFSARALAGSFSQDFSAALADGSVPASSNGTASIIGGQLRLTANGTGSTLAGYRLPDLDVGKEISEFTLDYDVTLYATGTPADGYALSFGAISTNNADLTNAAINAGEEGFNLVNGMSVIFDTYNNGNNEAPAIDAKANGIIVRDVYMGSGSPPGGVWSTAANTYPVNNVKRHVQIHWEVNTGLDVKIVGSAGTLVDVMVDQPMPGFTPTPGNVFAWGARTGGATEDVILDNIVITTVPVNPIDTGGPVISEFLVDNAGFGEDEDCQSGSWIEIYNGQNVTQNFSGWYLTDDAGAPAKWAIPATFSLTAYQYGLIWVDGKNRTVAPGTGWPAESSAWAESLTVSPWARVRIAGVMTTLAMGEGAAFCACGAGCCRTRSKPRVSMRDCS